ncbi:MAG: hypothetical protein JST83_00680 [Bacteroidetes bacterium]|nr:hypothetical protein [Bacteroidota bacterium]
MRAFFLFIFLSLIASISLQAQDTLPYPTQGRPHSVIRSDKEDGTITSFNGHSTRYHVPDKFIRKKNTGIGLTVAGIGVLATGIALYATAPKQTRYNQYGQAGQYTTVAGVIGVLMIPASLGLTIPGAVLWGKYARKIHRGQTR